MTDFIKQGDLVIAYVNPNDIKAFIATEGESFRNRHGEFPHSDIINKVEFGQKVASKSKSGFILLLKPTPELWTLALPHRTQILYHPDISLISTMLHLQPGTRMIEAGTGSGSFSHSIARTIAPHGQLFTFEYHNERAEAAEKEFELHGLSDIITIEHRNVCKDGFGIKNEVTAVFLDLPSPWEAIDEAKNALRKDRIGRICCFSPCVEQVQRTCQKLAETGWTGIQMFEILNREHDVRMLETLALPTTDERAPKRRFCEEGFEGIVTSRIRENIRGHTSFLTFATMLPIIE